jgi:hypothetical protein
MNPVTHALVGWTVANVRELDSRDRALVVLAGVSPDLDGLGIVVDLLTRSSGSPTYYWDDYHHVLCHNLGFGLLLGGLTFAIARRRFTATLLALLSFHLHLLGDLVGARGPDGDQWPIPYLSPFSDAWQLSWSGQWALNAWPNVVITVAVLALVLYLAWLRGYSPVGLLSRRADTAVVAALRARFGGPNGARLRKGA